MKLTGLKTRATNNQSNYLQAVLAGKQGFLDTSASITVFFIQPSLQSCQVPTKSIWQCMQLIAYNSFWLVLPNKALKVFFPDSNSS